MRVRVERVAQVSAQHDQDSLSEVDDVHHAEYERQPACHQRVKPSDQDPIDDGLENKHRSAPNVLIRVVRPDFPITTPGQISLLRPRPAWSP